MKSVAKNIIHAPKKGIFVRDEHKTKGREIDPSFHTVDREEYHGA